MNSFFYKSLIGGIILLFLAIYVLLDSRNIINLTKIETDEEDYIEDTSKYKIGKVVSIICFLCSFFLLFIAYSIFVTR